MHIVPERGRCGAAPERNEARPASIKYRLCRSIFWGEFQHGTSAAVRRGLGLCIARKEDAHASPLMCKVSTWQERHSHHNLSRQLPSFAVHESGGLSIHGQARPYNILAPESLSCISLSADVCCLPWFSRHVMLMLTLLESSLS